MNLRVISFAQVFEFCSSSQNYDQKQKSKNTKKNLKYNSITDTRYILLEISGKKEKLID